MIDGGAALQGAAGVVEDVVDVVQTVAVVVVVVVVDVDVVFATRWWRVASRLNSDPNRVYHVTLTLGAT